MNFARVFRGVYVSLSKNSVSPNLYKQTVACYSVKWQRRRPIKVYNPDGVTEIKDEETAKKPSRRSTITDEIQGVIELNKDFTSKSKKFQNDSAMNLQQSSDSESDAENKDDEVVGTSFVRLGDTDKLFDRRILNVQSKKQRDKSNMIMLEGVRLIQDAISAGIIPLEIFFTRKSLVENLAMPPGEIKLYKMAYNKMKVWSPLQTPPGIVAFCRLPKKLNLMPKHVIPLTLICDNVREPGNMGTILRTIAGVGCLKTILTKGCVDVWDSKVLRSAAGAHFHVPIESGMMWDEINQNADKDTRVFIAHHNEENETISGCTIPTIPYFSVNYSSLSNITVIIGGETEGISDDAIQFARYRDGLNINIPLSSNIDSLNVGAAVSTILFEIKRQFIINNKDVSYFNSDRSSNKNIQNDSMILSQ